MPKKVHKKLRELARLQSLHSNQFVGSAPAMATAVAGNTPVQVGKVNHLHTEMVKRDLRELLGLVILMIVLLLGMYWLVANTSFASWLLSLGHSIK